MKGMRLQIWLIFALVAVFTLMAGGESLFAAVDITDNVQLNKSRMLFDRRTNMNYFNSWITNISEDKFQSPVIVVIESISDPSVTVANADGTTDTGEPYFDYSNLLIDNIFDPHEDSSEKLWQFNNQNRVRFTFQMRVMAEEETSDIISPTINIVSPQDNSSITNIRPNISFTCTDDNSGVDFNTLSVVLNDIEISDLCTISGQDVNCQPIEDLPEGNNSLVVSIDDSSGNSRSIQAFFTVQYSFPKISITNPVSGGVLANATPFITIRYNDNISGIDRNSLNVEINYTDRTSLFDITENGATCQFNEGFSAGTNAITATVSNNLGLTSSATATFTVTSSSNPAKYLFSLRDNPWIFSSPGDGTYDEFITPNELGVSNLDITSLTLDHFGGYYFTQPGIPQIMRSEGNGSSATFLTNAELGISGPGPDAIDLSSDGLVHFSLPETADIFTSIGNSANSIFISSSDINADDSEITALHVDYDGLIYFASPAFDGVFESSGDSYRRQFLTNAALGVPEGGLDAFAMLPDATQPTLTITSPQNGAFLNTTRPVVNIGYSDEYSGINTGSFILTINGADFSNDCTVEENSATCQISIDLPVGSHSIVATVKDKAGNTASDTINIQIGILRAIPGATPVSGTSPLTVHFTSDGEDPAGTIQIFRWDFDGNGSWDTYDTVARDYNHTYNAAGTYTATLYVQSSTGESATAAVTITVENNPPTATADVTPSNGEVPLTVQMTGTGSDPDGQVVLYEWDYEGDGIYDWSSTTTGNTSHVYTTAGDYQAVFRVTDNSGLTATAVAAQTIVRAGPPGSPTAVAAASPVSGNAPLNVNLVGTATDPDNDIVLYEWDFDGDGTYDWSSPSTGNTNHTYNDAGTHEARFRVTDSTGLTGIDQVLITVNIQTSLSVARDTVGFLSGSGMTATASSQYSSSYAPSKAIDGNTGTYWHSANENGSTNSFFEVSFNAPQRISGFTARWYSTSYMYTNGRVEIFDNTGNIIFSQATALSGVNSQVSFAAVENAYRLRLTAITKSNSSWTVLREFEVQSSQMPGSVIEPTGTNINTTISAGTPVTIQIKNDEGNVIRTLVNNENRSTGSYSDYWDCKDDNGFVVNDGTYYAVMQYLVDGQEHTLDLTSTTGGSRYTPSRQSIPSNNNASKPFEDQMLPIYFSLPRASEVTLFVGTLYSTNTRIRTIYNRVTFPAGNHTAWWDGLDDNENIAVTPPGNRLILGIWGYYLPDNAMVMTGGKPALSNIAADPNYFCPFSEKCDNQGNGEGILLDYSVSENVESVELRVYSLETGNLIRTETQNSVQAGDNTFFWDGRNDDGEYADIGDYQVGLIARDAEGNESMMKYTLVRFDY